VGGPLQAALTQLGADLRGDIGSMSSLAIQATLSSSTSACSSLRSLSASWAAVILGLSAIVAPPSSILGTDRRS
jgi:hypothetical protein